MIDDFSTTFPEYSGLLNKWNRANLPTANLTVIDELFEYLVYPTHFSILLYQNADTFGDETVNTHFLPDIDFKKYNQRRNAKRENETDYLEISTVNPLHRYRNYKRKGRVRRLRKMFADVNSEEPRKINETISSMMGFFGSAADDATATATDEPDATPPPPTQVIYRTRRVERPSIGLFQVKSARSQKNWLKTSEDFQSLLGEDI
jgi:hypothetical protein